MECLVGSGVQRCVVGRHENRSTANFGVLEFSMCCGFLSISPSFQPAISRKTKPWIFHGMPVTFAYSNACMQRRWDGNKHKDCWCCVDVRVLCVFLCFNWTRYFPKHERWEVRRTTGVPVSKNLISKMRQTVGKREWLLNGSFPSQISILHFFDYMIYKTLSERPKYWC